MAGIKEREDGQRRGVGGGDYSREAIILNIFIKGVGAIIRGKRLIEGRLLFQRNTVFCKQFDRN